MNWDRKLSQVLILEDDTKLTTLRDAAGARTATAQWSRNRSRWKARSSGLMKAAKTGKRADNAAATDSVSRLPGHRQVLKRKRTPHTRRCRKDTLRAIGRRNRW